MVATTKLHANEWQKRFYLEWKLNQSSSAYNIYATYVLTGNIDITRLKLAIQKVANHYECFRTKFNELNGVLYQEINEQAEIEYFEECINNSVHEYVKVKISEVSHKPFDILNESLIRVQLLEKMESEVIVTFCFHHIVIDGFTIKKFFLMLERCYNGLSINHISPTMKEYQTYKDDSKLDELKLTQKWSELLHDIQIYTDIRQAKNDTSEIGMAIYHFFKEEEINRIKTFCRKNHTTLFCFISAIFSVCARRIFGCDELSFTYTVNIREREFQGQMGSFVNNLPMAVSIKNSDSIFDIISKITEFRKQSKSCQCISFSEIVNILRKINKNSQNNRFNLAIDATTFLLHPLNLESIVAQPILHDNMNVINDLSLGYEFEENMFGLRLHYRKNMFDALFMQSILNCIVALILRVTNEPNLVIDSIKIISDFDYQKYVITINDTNRNYVTNCNIIELFINSVNKTPNSIAIIDKNHELSYKELDRRANQLANFLLSTGIGVGEVVGVCVDRNVNLIISILGILKVGGVYLPLDSNYPVERLDYMLLNSNANYLIIESSVEKQLKFDYNKIKIHNINFEAYSFIAPQVNISLNDMSYIMYTSGSTGKPKGVKVSHGSIVDRICGLLEIYEVTNKWNHLQYGSYGFDASLEEFFLGLLKGGTVIIAPREAGMDPNILIELIKKYKVTAINFVPTVLNLFLDELKSISQIESCSTLERVISGGEVLSSNIVSKFYEKLNAKLYNTYGPTENTIDSVYYVCDKNNIKLNIPIGKPLPNSSVYVLDKSMQICLPGEIGELYVGGSGLASGYINDQELTNEKFIKAPPFLEKNGLLYRTGDLVKFNGDGNLEFIGRVDEQVKIRGLRIELDEIKLAILQLSEIKDVVIQIKHNDHIGQYIIAYVVPHQLNNNDETITYIRNKLTQCLPLYMIPSNFIILDKLPLTPNHKIDYKQLPEPNYISTEIVTELLSEVETKIITLCKTILGQENISINSNFFEIGGHSLLAIGFISRVNQLYDIKVQVKTLFEHPILRTFSLIVENIILYSGNLQKRDNLKITKVENKDNAYPLTYQQQSLWLADALLVDKSIYNVASVYKIDGNLNLLALESALLSILTRHEILRATFITLDNQVKQIINNIPTNCLKIVTTDNVDKTQIDKIIRQLVIQPFILDQGPLYAFSLILTSDLNYLVINFHHIIFDGLSSDIFLKELKSIYLSYCNCQPINLSHSNIQFSDFAYHYRYWQEESSISEQSDFWQKELANIPTILRLPFDYMYSENSSLTGETICFTIPFDVSKQLKQIAKSNSISLYSLLLSSLFILLSRYSNQNDIVIGITVANRPVVEVEQLIGFFVSVLPFRMNLIEEQPFKDFVKTVHQKFLEIMHNKDIPLEKLVKDNHIINNDINKLFNVMFVLENSDNSDTEIDKNNMSLLKLDSGTAKYDLSILMNEYNDNIEAKFEYRSTLFRRETIQNLIDAYTLLLKEVTNNYMIKIDAINIVTNKEANIIKQFNDTDFEFSKKKYLLHELFEESAILYPNKIAVVSGVKKINYSMLNTMANLLAKQLMMELTVGKPIAIIMEKGWEQVVATLAILKAGMVFLPINLNEPIERIKKILDKSNIQKIILQTNSMIYDELAKKYKIYEVDEDLFSNISIATTNIKVKRNSDDLAYIIYTSGSTGEPKGVMINHQGAVNTILDINKTYEVNDSDVILGLSQLNFDLAIYDIFGIFEVGATLVLPDAKDIREPSAWAKFILEQNVTIWNTVPALMQIFIDYLMLHRLNTTDYINSLRLILLSGDYIPLDLPKKIKNIFGSTVDIISLGGATEASIWSISHSIVNVDEPCSSIPYGKPMRNQQFYVFDSKLRHLPIGVQGELYIGGIGVALGYFNDIHRTQSSFIDHPYIKKLLYKTGDMGTLLSDGYIKFQGRQDNQVKLNGFRIELGEIENQLLQHEEVVQTVVLIDQEHDVKRQIVAFIVLNEYSKLNSIDLYQYLETRLPIYMLPKLITILDCIPLTTNGKVDRDALIKSQIRSSNNELKELKSATEVALAQIWKDILKIDDIGRNSNFFQLGGQSLTLVKLANEIQDKFNISISIQSLFDNLILSQMAKLINLLINIQNLQDGSNEDGGDVGVI